ncbi:haloacid dehalogenase type II [Nesterenkonia natronophila]|uniref:Haloacid dehalogenase type II n=1 Tax=Nesterenkonia natronophila TaxID=2174932 RepID=A0A3A4F3L6_9MICC|nr:haloacid dehalogenase type II [Nesterenkonia natronophila]RJN32942.1 haloacid dehalogenase type II [Nesterenkonia natronophila]
MATPAVIVFDVNETLSDMAPLASRFADIGAPRHLARLWFAQLLRDGFALAATGENVGFADIGTEMLREVLQDVPLDRGIEDAVSHVMEGIGELGVHPDVPGGIQTLDSAGFRLVTLSNGAAQVAQTLFARAGIGENFERLLSVEQAPAWKPARSAYEHAARQCGVSAEEMMLVAVHPWDIHGAARAGLSTAWINRGDGRWPRYFAAPDITAGSVEELANMLTGHQDPGADEARR